jgi:hypothetical protein
VQRGVVPDLGHNQQSATAISASISSLICLESSGSRESCSGCSELKKVRSIGQSLALQFIEFDRFDSSNTRLLQGMETDCDSVQNG